jgi:hypothetical protein
MDGQSNKQIARELGVTAKTVEFHVSKLLKKHDVRSRYELMDVLALASRGPLEGGERETGFEGQTWTADGDKSGAGLARHTGKIVGVLIRDSLGRVLLVHPDGVPQKVEM